MQVNVIIQKNDPGTHWTSLFLSGIEKACAEKGHIINIAESDGEGIPDSLFGENAAILCGSTQSWISRLSASLYHEGVKSVVAGSEKREGCLANGYAVCDYRRAIYSLIAYLEACNKTRIALYGVTRSSSTDKIKLDAFLSYGGGIYKEKDVFYFEGSTSDCLMSFKERCKEYDAVIGANDVQTQLLIHRLATEGVHVPEDLYAVSFGNSSYRKNPALSLTVALLDSVAVGRSAVDLYIKLATDSSISSLTVKHKCDIAVRASTENKPFKEMGRREEEKLEQYKDLFSEPPLTMLMQAEDILSRCDALDIEILRAYHKKKRTPVVAEELFLSEGAVKYRIKKLLSATNIASLTELLAIIDPYLG